MANIPAINIAPETITQAGEFAISNAMIATFTTSILLIAFAFAVRRKAGVVPSRMQVLFEILYEFIWEKMVIAFRTEEKAKKFFPLLFTMFLILIVANQFMLIPFIDSIITKDGIKLFRTPTSHYALPIVYTVLVLLIAHVLAIVTHPIRHIGNFIKLEPFFKLKSIKDLPMAFLDLFLGLLDIVGEFAKLASLSTRLFGNMFAGSIIVLIIGGLTSFTQFLVPIPFIALSILSGFVQAFVFVMLSMLYISATLQAVEPAAEMADAEATN